MDHEQDLKQSIVDAALALAEPRSWEVVRLHEVAEAAGITLDELRVYFREKEDIVEAWFDRADAAMLHAATAPGFLSLTTRRRLQRVIMAWLDALAPHRRVTRQMIYGKLEPGHLHIQIPGIMRVSRTVQWFRETLGFIASDDVYAGDKDNIIGSFNRCDRGDEYVDHHTLFCVHNERAGLNHMSFEVPDVDAVFKDHEWLKKLGKYDHMWGVGRHLLGSQVYDYWADPWGRVHERWADTDRLNARSGSNLLPANEALVSQWGEDPPERFIRHVSV